MHIETALADPTYVKYLNIAQAFSREKRFISIVDYLKFGNTKRHGTEVFRTFMSLIEGNAHLESWVRKAGVFWFETGGAFDVEGVESWGRYFSEADEWGFNIEWDIREIHTQTFLREYAHYHFNEEICELTELQVKELFNLKGHDLSPYFRVT